ncbi:MAG: hypothetical protein H6869_10035, partial [Rhodospirillales bacterium]|nr:hypothetical protein [Rhodospirillales bacterium]
MSPSKAKSEQRRTMLSIALISAIGFTVLDIDSSADEAPQQPQTTEKAPAPAPAPS